MAAHAFPAAPSGVLVLANDAAPGATRLSRFFGLALQRLGHRAVVRDTRLVRWGARVAAQAHDPIRQEAFEVAAVAKWAKLVEDYGLGLVLGIDLQWLVSRHLFLEETKVRRVHSFWLGEVEAAVGHAAGFVNDPAPLLTAPKLVHHCVGDAQEKALRARGATAIRRSRPAAPAEYLRAQEPCVTMNRLGHLGSPDESAASAAVRLLASRGLLDVYGDPAAWSLLGVEAQPPPSDPQRAALFRSHPAWLTDGAGPAPFEIAACGRLALVADGRELRPSYADDEMTFVETGGDWPAVAEATVRNPAVALAAGERARLRTAREHLWDHRLEAALA